MIIGEETDYFIYGCISTLMVESVLCIFYGYCFEMENSCLYYKKWRHICCKRNHTNRSLLDDDDVPISNSFEHISDLYDSPTNKENGQFTNL